MSVDIMQRMRVAFRAEALDLLSELDTALLALESDPGDAGLVHRVFRAIHTIKGSGATAGFERLAAFAHKVEEVFDRAREGQLAVTCELVDHALKACDVLRVMLSGEEPDLDPERAERVAAALAGFLPASASPAAPVCAGSQISSPEPRVAFEVIFRPNRELFYSGTDPVTLLDELRGLGTAHVVAHAEDLPNLSSLDPEACLLWWEIRLVTDRGEQGIKDVFLFVEDECEITLRRLDDQAGALAVLGAIPAETLDLFAQECEDHLQSIEHQALALESNPASRQPLDGIFRAMHSIKGNAGVLLADAGTSRLAAGHPLQLIFRLAHAVEEVLQDQRDAPVQGVSRDFIETVLHACDTLGRLLRCMERQTAAEAIPQSLLQRLPRWQASEGGGQTAAERLSAFANTASQCLLMMERSLGQLPPSGNVELNVCKMYLRGLRTLSAAGSYENCTDLEEPVATQLRILEASMQAGGELDDQSRTELRKACELTRGILARSGAFERPAVSEAPPAAPVPEVRADRSGGAPASPATIRIDQEKLDRLMRVVGELLVARGVFPILAQKLNEKGGLTGLTKEVKDAGANISRIAEELQASVMSIRMLPVKTVFQKFPRMVRDLARTLGKEVHFTTDGENTELDKTILEQVGDPLVHLIRNAVDHGVEPPEERQRKGKPPAGQVTVRASNQAGGVVIEIFDDGRGLNSEALKRKAVEKGVLAPEAAAAMGEIAAFQLIFLPGVTTAARVSDVSGRGVGMDVVRNNIQNLQGTIDIESAPGEGTKFSIKLPTSLMISKGILLTAGSHEYILPLGNIADMVKIDASQVRTYRRQKIAHIRGRVYPLISLAESLGFEENERQELSVAIIDNGKIHYGLIVDRLVSEVEVVVKPLAGGLEKCKEFLGAAIMGDGRVVLVLNPLEFLNQAKALDRAGISQPSEPARK
jgi:two-component system chemotaxis sensor kinase CheA